MDTNGVREENVVKRWLVGRRKEEYPPTWRSLYKVLKELGLEELSKKVEEFLSKCVSSVGGSKETYLQHHQFPQHC